MTNILWTCTHGVRFVAAQLNKIAQIIEFQPFYLRRYYFFNI